MRLLTATAFLSLLIGSGFGQNGPATPGNPEQVRVMANQQIKEGGTFKLRGHVQIVTPSTSVYADEADYSPLTGEIDARGHVHINLKNTTSAQMEQLFTQMVEDAPQMTSAQMEEFLTQTVGRAPQMTSAQMKEFLKKLSESQ